MRPRALFEVTSPNIIEALLRVLCAATGRRGAETVVIPLYIHREREYPASVTSHTSPVQPPLDLAHGRHTKPHREMLRPVRSGWSAVRSVFRRACARRFHAPRAEPRSHPKLSRPRLSLSAPAIDPCDGSRRYFTEYAASFYCVRACGPSRARCDQMPSHILKRSNGSTSCVCDRVKSIRRRNQFGWRKPLRKASSTSEEEMPNLEVSSAVCKPK